MSAVDQLFTDLRNKGRKALMPFITAGDPDLHFTADLLRTLVDAGAHICELGIPYSDPIADGPVIQASYTRALAGRLRLADILEMLGDVSPGLRAPLVTMVSYAIVYRHGVEQYVGDAKAAGAAGAIVPDLPADEADQLVAVCRREDFSLIQLITPTTPRDRARRIIERTTGFLYYVSVAGITGERRELPPELAENVAWLHEQTDLPICIGFGISRPEHVKALTPVADGLIVGSAIVRRIAQGMEATAEQRPRSEVLAEIGQFTTELLAAMGN
ncbi:MAG: tryptophan synthase subunit alpha [Pirellulales bacterium]